MRLAAHCQKACFTFSFVASQSDPGADVLHNFSRISVDQHTTQVSDDAHNAQPSDDTQLRLQVSALLILQRIVFHEFMKAIQSCLLAS